MTTAIGQTEIDMMIIRAMIGMMIIEEMMIVGIIITMIIRHEMTGGHTKVTNIVMIEAGMRIIDMIIVDSLTTKGMIKDDTKDLDNFNIILRVQMMQNHRIFCKKV